MNPIELQFTNALSTNDLVKISELKDSITPHLVNILSWIGSRNFVSGLKIMVKEFNIDDYVPILLQWCILNKSAKMFDYLSSIYINTLTCLLEHFEQHLNRREIHLCQNIIDIISPENYYALLAFGSKCGCIEIVEYILDKNIDLSTNECHALTWAAQFNHFDIVQILIEAGANVNEASILWSVFNNNLTILMLMFTRIIAKKYQGDAMLVALEKNHFEIVKFLLEKNVIIRDEMNLLDFTINNEFSNDILRLMKLFQESYRKEHIRKLNDRYYMCADVSEFYNYESQLHGYFFRQILKATFDDNLGLIRKLDDMGIIDLMDCTKIYYSESYQFVKDRVFEIALREGYLDLVTYIDNQRQAKQIHRNLALCLTVSLKNKCLPLIKYFVEQGAVLKSGDWDRAIYNGNLDVVMYFVESFGLKAIPIPVQASLSCIYPDNYSGECVKTIQYLVYIGACIPEEHAHHYYKYGIISNNTKSSLIQKEWSRRQNIIQQLQVLIPNAKLKTTPAN
jgi:hypothetical protein